MKYWEALKKNWKPTILLFIPCLLLLFQVDLLMVLTVELWLVALLISIDDFSNNIFFSLFLCSFFVFLISGDLAEQIFHIYYYRQFKQDAVIHSQICIILSIIFMTLGFVKKRSNLCLEKLPAPAVLNEKIHLLDDMAGSAQKVSLIAFLVTFPILLFDTINKIVFVALNGYIAYYSSYDPLLPSIVVKLGEMAHVALCVFLATFPRKKHTQIVLILYLIFAVLGMATGQRGAFIYRLAFVLAYVFLRQKVHNHGEVWIKKRTIIALLVAAPFLLAFLFAYGYIRMGNDVPDKSIGELFASFFVNIGSTSQLIKDGYVLDAAIPRTKLFSIGGIINYFKYGTLFNLFRLDTLPVPHTAEFALEGHRFDAFLSYLTMPERYFGGEGTGSCFIAELFADFGYLGICAGSFIYGMFFKTLSNLKEKNWLSCAVLLYMVMHMIKTPRGAYDDFLTAVINVVYIAFMVMIVVAIYLHHTGFFAAVIEKLRNKFRKRKQV